MAEYSSGSNVPPPPNHLGLALLAVVLFFPLGIAATLKSARVGRLWGAGQHTEALEAASGAKAQAVWGIVLGVLVIAAYIALRVANIGL